MSSDEAMAVHSASQGGDMRDQSDRFGRGAHHLRLARHTSPESSMEYWIKQHEGRALTREEYYCLLGLPIPETR